jgi:hypothetical protein
MKIFNIEDLYISTKLSFLNSIRFNSVSYSIFNHLCINKNKRNRFSKSFIQDIKLLEKHFENEISAIFEKPLLFKKLLKLNFSNHDGISDSINECLKYYKSKTMKQWLVNVTKPNFIRDNEEFQELMQYLIIEGYS